MTYALNRVLPPEFVARYDERCYVLPWADTIYPDSAVYRQPPDVASSYGVGPEGAGGLAVAVPSPTPSLLFRESREEQREAFIEIVSVAAQESVITVVELLSPANKAIGSGRDEYRRKQASVLASGSHLLEIDLLRGGTHTLAMERAPIAARKPFDYLVCLSRVAPEAPAGGRAFECWPFTVREAMPVVRVPLTPGTPEITLDLRAATDRVYDGARYGRTLRYARDPEPLLSPADAAWADALLRERGLRP